MRAAVSKGVTKTHAAGAPGASQENAVALQGRDEAPAAPRMEQRGVVWDVRIFPLSSKLVIFS